MTDIPTHQAFADAAAEFLQRRYGRHYVNGDAVKHAVLTGTFARYCGEQGLGKRDIEVAVTEIRRDLFLQ